MAQNEDTKPEAAPIVVEEFSKNNKETLRISLTEYQGHEFCEIWAWFPSAEGMKPGKGISIQRFQVVTLRKALQKAERMIRGDKPAAAGAAAEQEGRYRAAGIARGGIEACAAILAM